MSVTAATKMPMMTMTTMPWNESANTTAEVRPAARAHYIIAPVMTKAPRTPHVFICIEHFLFSPFHGRLGM